MEGLRGWRLLVSGFLPVLSQPGIVWPLAMHTAELCSVLYQLLATQSFTAYSCMS